MPSIPVLDWVRIETPLRGIGTQTPFEFGPRSFNLTWAWGVNPSPGAVTYVASTPGGYPLILPGARIDLHLFGRDFWGIVQGGPTGFVGNVTPTVEGSSGHEMQIRFVDTRLYLQWDRVFGAFNQMETRIVDGVWTRRYWHIYPNDWMRVRKSYSNSPLSAVAILNALFNDSHVGTVWLRDYHIDQLLPYPRGVDAMSGRSLAEVIQELCDAQGLTLTLKGGPYRLVFARKGEGLLPEFPANADNLTLEQSMSDAPSRVFIVGDRNLYMVLNVAMNPDWNKNWEELYHVDLLMSDLFNNERHTDGQRYDSMTGDTEQATGWQLAKTRALSITVGEYSALRLARDGKSFNDPRKYMSRARSQMPAALYIRTLLFRAFRPPPTLPIEGVETYVEDLVMVNEQVAYVAHDTSTGDMTAYLEPPADRGFSGGNGYSIAKGYDIGSELFGMIQPDRFDITMFNVMTNLWQPMTGSIDAAGDGSQFILFDEPIIHTDGLIDYIDQQAVLKATPIFSIPAVRSVLTVEGPRYFYTYGTPSRDEVLNVSGLRREVVVKDGDQTDAPYADGDYPDDRALALAKSFLSRAWVYNEGGYTIKLEENEVAPDLLTTMGRVTVQKSDQGNIAIVEFEKDRPIRYYVPETTMDRAVRQQSMLPGQDELRAVSHTHKLLAQGLKSHPHLIHAVKLFLKQSIGAEVGTVPTEIVNGTGTLEAGTPLWKIPSVQVDGKWTETRPVMPASTTDAHKKFVGATMRNGEPAQNFMRVQNRGEPLIRVMGPVAFGDTLVQSPGNDWLEKKGATDATAVGTAQIAIETEVVTLIPVSIGVSGGTTSAPVWS